MIVENLDGGVKDQDLFVLADDEDEDDEDDGLSMDEEERGHVYRSTTPSPPNVISTVSPLLETPPSPPVVGNTNTEEASTTNTTPAPDPAPNEDGQSAKQDAPVVYRLRRGDTLMGIALRFRLDVCFFTLNFLSLNSV